MAAIAPGSHCDEVHLAEAEALMASTGRVLRIPERQMDAVTAISGSGPAYIFFVVESMIEAGVHLFPGVVPGTDATLSTPKATGSRVRTGLSPAALTCSILTETGTTATVDETRAFAAEHGLIVLQIADVAAYRRQREDVIERIGEAVLPVPGGRMLARGFRDRYEPGEHIALITGDLAEPGPVMVRVHT